MDIEIKATLKRFKELNERLDELDQETNLVGYGAIDRPDEYEQILKGSQALYRKLEKAGVDPFKEEA